MTSQPAPSTSPGSPGSTTPSRGNPELAAALCDLVDDPDGGVARVTLAGAPWDVGEALEAEAARRGIPARGDYFPVSRRSRVVLRPAAEVRLPCARSGKRHALAPLSQGALIIGALCLFAVVAFGNASAEVALLVLGLALAGVAFWLEGPEADAAAPGYTRTLQRRPRP